MIETQAKTMRFLMRKVSKPKLHVIVSSIILALFGIDYLTGTEISFSIFYLIPISVSVVFNNRKSGFFYSIVCSIAWITADVLGKSEYSSVIIPVWNAVVRFSYFSFHTAILSSLIDVNKNMHEMSQRDPLTKTANWRFFEEFANRKIKDAVREGVKIALVYMDIDNFKDINDELGHSMGDEVLKAAANGMQAAIRSQDLAARLGGDEFALLLYNANKDDTLSILQRMKEQVGHQLETHGWSVTFSIGAVVFNVLPSTIGPMIKRVDEVMYEVKKAGKNDLKIVDQFL